MIKYLKVKEELYKVSNMIEVSFCQNMHDYIFVLCDIKDAEQLQAKLKDMFKDCDYCDIYINKESCVVVLCTE